MNALLHTSRILLVAAALSTMVAGCDRRGADQSGATAWARVAQALPTVQVRLVAVPEAARVAACPPVRLVALAVAVKLVLAPMALGAQPAARVKPVRARPLHRVRRAITPRCRVRPAAAVPASNIEGSAGIASDASEHVARLARYLTLSTSVLPVGVSMRRPSHPVSIAAGRLLPESRRETPATGIARRELRWRVGAIR